jgi:Putative porin
MTTKFSARRTATAAVLPLALLFSGQVAQAQSAPQAPAPTATEQPPSESAMVNLVRVLVRDGALSVEMGDSLIRQAEAEAAKARAAAQLAAGQLPGAAQGAIRVPYIPETVRQQIRDELRAEIMNQPPGPSWVAPRESVPDWTRRVTIHGDVRFRSQSALYSRTNSNAIFNFAAINAIGPVDIENPFTPLPLLNTRRDRWNQLRLRARLGFDAVVTKGVTAGITLATGNDDGPISTNQVLGGGFGKKDIWLDKAWVKVAPEPWMAATFGRFEKPFASSDLLYDQDLNLDGVALSFSTADMLGENTQVSLTGGAFSLDFGSADQPVFSATKEKIPHTYLFSAELAGTTTVSDTVKLKLAAGYHMFRNVQGQLSAPCDLAAGAPECSTDRLRPIFLGKGNTLSPLRQIVDDPTFLARPQFLGLTFGYRVLDANASVEFPVSEDMDLHISGNYVKNLAFKESDICRNGQLGQPVNNGGIQGNGRDFCGVTSPVNFVGGDTGYRFEALLGRRDIKTSGQWQVRAGYRYLESDAVLDSLTDSDFHLGGTNAKGYFLGASYGLFDGVTVGGRWMSANEVAGEPFAIDVLQVDLEAKF